MHIDWLLVPPRCPPAVGIRGLGLRMRPLHLWLVWLVWLDTDYYFVLYAGDSVLAADAGMTHGPRQARQLILDSGSCVRRSTSTGKRKNQEAELLTLAATKSRRRAQAGGGHGDDVSPTAQQ